MSGRTQTQKEAKSGVSRNGSPTECAISVQVFLGSLHEGRLEYETRLQHSDDSPNERSIGCHRGAFALQCFAQQLFTSAVIWKTLRLGGPMLEAIADWHYWVAQAYCFRAAARLDSQFTRGCRKLTDQFRVSD